MAYASLTPPRTSHMAPLTLPVTGSGLSSNWDVGSFQERFDKFDMMNGQEQWSTVAPTQCRTPHRQCHGPALPCHHTKVRFLQNLVADSEQVEFVYPHHGFCTPMHVDFVKAVCYRRPHQQALSIATIRARASLGLRRRRPCPQKRHISPCRRNPPSPTDQGWACRWSWSAT
jgi:hypothetical protein